MARVVRTGCQCYSRLIENNGYNSTFKTNPMAASFFSSFLHVLSIVSLEFIRICFSFSSKKSNLLYTIAYYCRHISIAFFES